MERRDTLRSISELVEESTESGFDPLGHVAILTSEASEPYNVAYRPLGRPSNPCPPNSAGNSQENIPEDQQVRQRRKIFPPADWARPLYSKANGIKKNSKQFSSSGFNMLLFVDNATVLGDYIKITRKSSCMPSDFIYSGIVFIVLSLILQFLHLVFMSLFPKPDKKLKTECPEKYEQMVKKHETKMIVENGLAIAILFINLLVTYVVRNPVKSYDYINCTF